MTKKLALSKGRENTFNGEIYKYFSKQEQIETTRSLFGLSFVPKASNVWLFSYDSPSMSYIKDNLIDEEDEDLIPIKKHYLDWVKANYMEILTPCQVKYINDIMDGKEKEYKFQTRYYYRQIIQKKLMDAYFHRPTLQYYRRLEQDLDKLTILRKIRDKADDNKAFMDCIVKHIDNPYVNELVYGNKLSAKAFREVGRHLRCKEIGLNYPQDIVAISEIYDIILLDIAEVKTVIYSHLKA